MNIFFAGATGVIGRPLLYCLLNEGHEITALTRSQAHARELHARGAKAIVADVFDREIVRQAIIEARPAAVINQLTNIPHNFIRAMSFRNLRRRIVYGPRARRF